jgi:hypothetical protein
LNTNALGIDWRKSTCSTKIGTDSIFGGLGIAEAATTALDATGCAAKAETKPHDKTRPNKYLLFSIFVIPQSLITLGF